MNNKLLGAIIGDICGSSYEMDKALRARMKQIDPKEIVLVRGDSDFTDDTICTIAIADAILHDKVYEESLITWCRKYNCKGCGPMFREWVNSDFSKSYGSFGNGSAMRVSPVAWATDDLLTCLDMATNTCLCSHNSDEGIKGARAIAHIIWAVKNGVGKTYVKKLLCSYYPSFIGKTLDEIRPTYQFDATCQGSVPHAILCFLESDSYEHCLQLAISLGGDSDTIACMAGSIANAYYDEIPEYLINKAYSVLPCEIVTIIREFEKV